MAQRHDPVRAQDGPLGDRAFHFGFPWSLRGVERRRLSVQHPLQPGDPNLKFLTPRFLFRSREQEVRFMLPDFALALGSDVIPGSVKEGQETVIVLLSEWVELVVVALCALESSPKPYSCRSVDAVDRREPLLLLRVGSPFKIEQRVPVKTAGYLLVNGRIR